MNNGGGVWAALLGNAPKIIAEAAQSGLGILALVILVLAVLAIVFFKPASDNMKLGVFAALFVAFVGLSLVAIYQKAEVAAASPDGSPGMTLPLEKCTSDMTAAEYDECIEQQRARQSGG